jgi:hypothetical protein
MKGWLGRLSLRYKLTLAALTVEALMLAFLIANGVHLTRQELQQQAEQRVRKWGNAGCGPVAPLCNRMTSACAIVDACGAMTD